MKIIELKSDCGSATVKLSYKEIRILATALSEYKNKKDEELTLTQHFGMLQHLVKDGVLDFEAEIYDLKNFEQ